MTTPRTKTWTKKAYIKIMLAIIATVCIVLASVWFYFGIYNSSSATSSSQNKQLGDDLTSNSLKSLVKAWLTENKYPSNSIGWDVSEDGESLTSTLVSLLNASMPALLSNTTDLQDVSEYRLIYPQKIQVPLHEDDLLYESKKNYSSAFNLDNIYPHHKTGHYRNKSSKIWDPHPQYEIDAFEHQFRLLLDHEAEFIPQDIKVTHVWNSSLLRKKEEQKDKDTHKQCHYRGKIVNDDMSIVILSLCDGMQGHFRTSSGSFFIQPIEDYANENKNILHLLYRAPQTKSHDELDTENSDLPNASVEKEEEIELKILNDTLVEHSSRAKRNIQLSPREQQMQRYHQQLLHKQYEDHQKQLREREREREQREQKEREREHQKNSERNQNHHHNNHHQQHQESSHNSLSRTNSNINNNNKYRDGRRYQQLQQSPSHYHDNQKYQYQHDYQNPLQQPANQKSHENNEYTIEVLVGVDKKMQEYHGSSLQNYVLTLMSVVSSIYADASIGNSIKIAVVHIMYVEHDLVPDASSGNGVSASSMLLEFCRLKQTHEFPHDTALLLTREQICRSANQKKCDTLGLAELGTMCKPSSCAIVQDNGLSAAFTIAHELGHVLNMPHDDDKRCDKFRGSTKDKQNIMSRMLDHNTHPWSWSNCSRHYASEFLDRDQNSCLLDKPKRDMIERSTNSQLAGEKFTDNQQCELVFGSGAQICTFMPKCSRLWCSQSNQEDVGCRTQHMPWADGTKCDNDQWCQKGECVARNRSALAPVDGGWGGWSSYGECSRVCGGGIHSSIRNCDTPAPANGGNYCTGQRIQYKSCNTQDCPDDAKDFRGEQCSRFDNNNFNMATFENVKWMPKYGLDKKDECKLYCRADKSSTYFALAPKVSDGTPCTYQEFNKCINGACIPAGCDNELYSTAELDMCGVCKGKNETCESHNGNLTHHQFRDKARYQSGYYFYSVVTIPKGATNIEITQIGYEDDQNYIALRDDHDEYILNSLNHIEEHQKTIYYGGITLEYNGGKQALEKVNSTYARQLKRELKVDILSFKTPNHIEDSIISYSYSQSDPEKVVFSNHIITSYNQPTAPKKQYIWQMQEWSECSHMCSGQSIRKSACVELNSNSVVPESYCRTSAKQYDDYKDCNTECKLGWEAFKSDCSVTCGEGNRTIKYECVQRNMRNNEHSKVVDQSNCPQRYETTAFEVCMQPCNEVLWVYSDWGTCSQPCGGGKQNRSSMCLSDPVHRRPVSDKYCLHLRREELVRYCNQDVNCAEWAYGEDTPCSVTCGKGQRVTVIYCKQNNEPVNPSLCGTNPRPKDIIKSCSMPSCEAGNNKVQEAFVDNSIPRKRIPVSSKTTDSITQNNVVTTPITTSKYEWRTGRWGDCSVTCGAEGGKKIRSVRCVNAQSQSESLDIVDDLYCEQSMRPINVARCNEFRCPQWNFGTWGKCNECKRYRQVLCQDHRGKTSDQCPIDLEPQHIESCCHFKWRAIWKPCSVTCGTGIRVKERVCMRLNPKSPDNPHPIKNGTKVDPKYCSHLPTPKYEKMKKACKSKNPCEFRWIAGPWSKCSSGCGTGHATRNVTCTNGRYTSTTECNEQSKSIKYKQCESRSSCRWKTGKWKNCTCGGYSKRRVTCWDSFKNTAASSCSETERSSSRQRCAAPPNCSCKSIQHYQKTRSDGEYKLNIRGREVEVFCHSMNTHHPTEYVTLKSGIKENYSLFYSKRSSDMSKCENGKGSIDESIQYGTTRFEKIRLNINSLQVMEDDYIFAHITGKPQQFASGGDCYSNSGSCPQGDFFVNLEGTGFRIRPSTTWETSGANSTIGFQIRLEKPYQKVRARCGGYCGSCQPSRIGFYLDVL